MLWQLPKRVLCCGKPVSEDLQTKHKVYKSSNTLCLQIKNKQLFFQIENSKKAKKRIDNVSGGVGLNNIKQRLQLLYPNKHELKIDDEKYFYKVRLTLNLK